MTRIGSRVSHSIITPECRASRGDEGAWNEAVARAKAQYDAIVAGWRESDLQPTLNLVLGMVRPYVNRGDVDVQVCQHGTPVVQDCAKCAAQDSVSGP